MKDKALKVVGTPVGEESKRRNRTAGERAVSIIGFLAGATLEEVNEQIRQDARRAGNTPRPIPASSWKTYGGYADRLGLTAAEAETWRKVWGHVTAPRPVGDT